MSNTFSVEIDLSLQGKLLAYLEEENFTISQPQYTIFAARKPGVSVALYQSGKLTVQGKEKDSFISTFLEPEILKAFPYTYPELSCDMDPHIGVDEAGKGDFFGPLCTASLYADKKGIQNLLKLGIKDSKKIQDRTIMDLAKKLKQQYPHQIICLFPEKYNELYRSFRNLNSLLAWSHAAAIEATILQTSCKRVTLDQFASEHVVINALKKRNIVLKDLTQRHKGEQDPVVAAASILARDAFLQGLEKMKHKWHFTFPKGASSIVLKAGKNFIQEFGQEKLPLVCKTHFQTYDKILPKNL